MMRHILVIPVPNYDVLLAGADLMALLADSDLFSRGPSSCFPESDSSVSYYDIFFFPFSLCVKRLLGSVRGVSTAEASLLADSSFG